MSDDHLSPEWRAEISRRALKNCTDYFNELARNCAIAIAVTLPTFDGSMLTRLIQFIDPHCRPNPNKVAFYRNGRENLKDTRELQRNYFTSAAKQFFDPIAFRGEKVRPTRKGTNDRVHSYTSRMAGRKDHGVPAHIFTALEKMLKGGRK